MLRTAGIVVAALVVIAGVYVATVYTSLNAFQVLPVAGDVHVIQVERLGGNVGVLATARGAVVVDTMAFRFQGEQILEMAEEYGGGPVQLVINTHYHQEHTHGNAAFPAGTRVVSTGRTRDYLLHFAPEFWSDAGEGTLPNETFADSHQVTVGGKTIRSLHLGRGHTGGDLVVLFVEDRVLHTGDLLFHRRYPNIDLEAGGSIPAWIRTLDRALALDFDRVIPGHGAITDREGIQAFQRFLAEIWALGLDAAEQGLGLEQTLAGAELSEDGGYQAISFPFVFRLDRSFAIRRAWQEATGAVKPVEVPGS